MFPEDIAAAAERLLKELGVRRMVLATAESCTGGLIVAAMTEIAGSSSVVDRGFVTYSNEAKMELLDVPAETIEQHGAVSQQTALAMVAGALAHSRADVAVAVTGIAGPGGGSADKPVGLVHIAAGRKGAPPHHRACRFGDIGRSSVREATVREAFAMIRQAISEGR